MELQHGGQRKPSPEPSSMELQHGGQRQPSPESSSMELQHSGHLLHGQTPTEDNCVDVHTCSGEKDQEGELKSKNHHLTKGEDTALDEQPGQEEEEMEEEDGGVLEEEMPPLKQQETLTDMLSPEGEPEASQSSQDVGFWESEEVDDKEEEEQQEALSVEEMIKRNRCYEDEEEEDV